MTQHRVETGESDAGLRTLRELALAAGLDISINLLPASDPDAAAGARSIIDASVDAGYLTPSQTEWAQRIRRYVGPELNPIDVVTEAGRVTNPLHRVGAVLLTGGWDELKLASAALSAGGEWLLSGTPVLERIADEPIALDPHAIVYAEDPEAVARFLSHLRPARAATATIVVMPMAPIAKVDSWTDGKFNLVAPVQAIIDSIGLGGSTAEAALAIAREW
ncbi:hypothetical protein [Rhodoglobus aureus]